MTGRAAWRAYLRDLSIPQKDRVSSLWGETERLTGGPLPTPSAGVGPDGNLVMAWGCPHLYADIEVFPDGSYECFYSYSHEDYGGDEEPRRGPVPTYFITELRHLLTCNEERATHE